MTKKEMFDYIATVNADNAEIVDFCKHEIELLNKRSGSTRKPTKTQVENETFKTDIIDYLSTCDDLVTIKQLQNGVDSLKDLSNQRITHLLTALVKEGKVMKEYVKKVAHFALV